MVIAVVGATGQLGSELLSLWGDRAVGLTRDQLDLADPATVEAALEAPGARVVVNAAAYNQVDLAESEPAVAMEVNSQGPRRLARWCASHGLRLVHVSSDFVSVSIRLEIRRTPSRMRPVRWVRTRAASWAENSMSAAVVPTTWWCAPAACTATPRGVGSGGPTSWRRCCDWPPVGGP